MADIENAVRYFQQEIISCIKEPTIVSLLDAASVISKGWFTNLTAHYIILREDRDRILIVSPR